MKGLRLIPEETAIDQAVAESLRCLDGPEVVSIYIISTFVFLGVGDRGGQGGGAGLCRFCSEGRDFGGGDQRAGRVVNQHDVLPVRGIEGGEAVIDAFPPVPAAGNGRGQRQTGHGTVV